MTAKLEHLKRVFGHDDFREGQEALVDSLLAGRDCLGIMPTGAGKSICYQLPSLLLPGITLVVSPLISLMKDQVSALIQSGVPAAYINSSLTAGQCQLALERARQGAYKLIYVAPERLATPSFRRFAMEAPIALVAVDEAHCVSQWGQDFRPSYLSIADFIDALPQRPPVGAYTATATDRVRQDIVKLLRLQNPLVWVGGFDRPGLFFSVLEPKDKEAALLQLLALWPNISGIIYCATRKNVDSLCNLLRLQGYSAQRYHAGMGEAERRQAQDDFQFDRAQLMVATNAFGMGIDKSNVGFVIHHSMPKNLESYYQEAGRAGRDGSEATCVLLYQKRDVMLARWMITHGDSNPELSLEQRELIRRMDLERLKQMTFYAAGKRCLRQSIIGYFGQQAPKACGYCSVCRGEPRELKQLPRAPLRKLSPEPAGTEALRFAALRALRNSLAREKGIPAYAVFTDASLRLMALHMPGDAKEFLAISGVGDKKLQSYGEVFLSFIAKLRDQSDERLSDSATVQQMALNHCRARAPWSDQELRLLRAQAAQGMSLAAIAQAQGRSEEAVAAKLTALRIRTHL